MTLASLSLLLALAAGNGDDGAPQTTAGQALQPASMVIADGGSRTRAEADAKREAFVRQGIPAHGDYPRVVESSTVSGLRPGFWAVVVGVPRDEAVARRLQAFLRARSIQAYIRKVMVAQPEDLHLLVVKGSRVSCQEQDHPRKRGRTHHMALLDGEDCVGECEDRTGNELSRAEVGPGGQVVIPYTPDQVPEDKRLYLQCREEPSDFEGLNIAAYATYQKNPGLDARASFPALEARITELPFVTCGCFFYDDIPRYGAQ